MRFVTVMDQFHIFLTGIGMQFAQPIYTHNLRQHVIFTCNVKERKISAV